MVCPRFVLLGLALLVSGCAALDRLGDTRLTDGVAPVFDPEVPYFPSTDAAVSAMLELARTGPNDVVYDLGCGDGRIVIAAAKDFGARGVGVEIDPAPLRMAVYRAQRAGVPVIDNVSAERATRSVADLVLSAAERARERV